MKQAMALATMILAGVVVMTGCKGVRDDYTEDQLAYCDYRELLDEAADPTLNRVPTFENRAEVLAPLEAISATMANVNRMVSDAAVGYLRAKDIETAYTAMGQWRAANPNASADEVLNQAKANCFERDFRGKNAKGEANTVDEDVAVISQYRDKLALDLDGAKAIRDAFYTGDLANGSKTVQVLAKAFQNPQAVTALDSAIEQCGIYKFTPVDKSDPEDVMIALGSALGESVTIAYNQEEVSIPITGVTLSMTTKEIANYVKNPSSGEVTPYVRGTDTVSTFPTSSIVTDASDKEVFRAGFVEAAKAYLGRTDADKTKIEAALTVYSNKYATSNGIGVTLARLTFAYQRMQLATLRMKNWTAENAPLLIQTANPFAEGSVKEMGTQIRTYLAQMTTQLTFTGKTIPWLIAKITDDMAAADESNLEDDVE